jgi:UDP-N-acetylmuramyl pentapeptide phosphotransferase/UDP-N-acetylglucosamine-1-phosphate transferase
MIGVIISFIISLTVAKVIIYTGEVHGHLTLDHDLSGIQKMHETPVPRVGGVAIFVSLVFTALYSANTGAVWSGFYAGLITALFFVFIAGLTEDLSKAVSPLVRISFMLFAVLYAVYVSHSMPLIRYMGEYNLNYILRFDAMAIAITCFAVIGISNAYNIIDGFNGLSTTAGIINIVGLAYLSAMVGDTTLLFVSLSLVAAILGFLVFNYPKGKIFLGDGGSYSLGFMISLISLNLTETYHHQISPYAILLLAVYPFTETVFSILRRKFVHKTRAMAPDNLHLHQLVFDCCLPRGLPLIRRNSGVMPIMLLFIMPQLFMVMFYYHSNAIMLLGLLSYVVLYVYIYMRLIRFKVPRWLVVKKS